MIKIIVADDEKNIRDIVANFINNAGNEYKVIGRAENGKQALEMIKSYQPDILISDICMPVMDGLELLREIKKLELPVKKLIISEFNEFEYAKKAISLGVSEYLLKPFLPNELMDILNDMKQEIEKQRIIDFNLQNIKSELEYEKKKDKDEFILSVLDDELDELEILEHGRSLDVDICANMYCVCNIRFLNSDFDYKKLDALYSQLLIDTEETYFDEKVKWFTAFKKNSDNFILFSGSYQNDSSFSKELKRGLAKIINKLSKQYNIQMHCALGGIYCDLNKISLSKKETQTIWNGLIEEHTSIVCYYDYLKYNSTFSEIKPIIPEQLNIELIIQIQMCRKKDALDTLNRIINHYHSYPVKMKSFVSISLLKLFLSITEFVKNNKVNIQYEEYETYNLEECFLSGRLIDIKKIMLDYISECCDELSKVNVKQSDKIVSAVKELIEKNIENDEFDIEAIASALFFSIHYIRQVFKQKTNENILEYLIQRRMEKAKDILNEFPEIKIAEVAERTGYKNQRYFATAFRKYYGSSPTVFREKTPH